MTRFQKSMGIGLVIVGGFTWVASAQFQRRPVLSPPTSTSITIEGKTIRIDYGAPSARGRKVIGGLVPYGEVWCTGANDQTSIMTEADLDINGMKLPKGSYTLYTLPNEKVWKLIINKQTGQFHTEYHPDWDFGRVPMNIKTLAEPVETLKLTLANDGGNKGTLAIAWEKTEVSVPFTVLR
jgi:hypothetical protein